MALVAKGLDKTRDLWPDVRVAFPWIHAAARILNNAEEFDAPRSSAASKPCSTSWRATGKRRGRWLPPSTAS